MSGNASVNSRAGIKEVATEAGVSIATVSRAIRGLHHVNPETRKKILDAAEKLNYPIPQTQNKRSEKLGSTFFSITSLR